MPEILRQAKQINPWFILSETQATNTLNEPAGVYLYFSPAPFSLFFPPLSHIFLYSTVHEIKAEKIMKDEQRSIIVYIVPQDAFLIYIFTGPMTMKRPPLHLPKPRL